MPQRKKLAYLIGSFPNLSEKFLINQISGIIDVGLDPDVFSVVAASDAPRHVLAEKYDLYNKTIYAGISRSNKQRFSGFVSALVKASASGLPKLLRSLNIFIYRTASVNLKNLFFLPVFQERKCDVLHCHFGPNGLIGAFLKDCGFVDRLVVSFHGSDINTHPKRHGSNVYHTLYDRADVVTVNSRFTREKVIANGCDPDKLIILPVGLKMEEYPEHSFPDRKPFMLLTVGRLVEKKGHRYALEAFALLSPHFPLAEYFIAGDGPSRESLTKMAETRGIANAVHFLGAQNDLQIAELYRRASVFVLPSVTAADGDMEGQGLVLQEAQASGIPVVSTLHNGIPDGVLDGVSGYLVPERDPEALADRISRLFSDTSLRENMGQAGRRFVSQTYDIPLLTERLLKVYEM